MRRILAAVLLASAGCASLLSPDKELERSVVQQLERRGLGAESLLVIDNLLRHGPSAPRATPPLVLELLSRPLVAADAAAVFRRAVPASLTELEPAASNQAFDDLLKSYLEELAEAQRLLRAATRDFGELEFPSGLPSPLAAIAEAIDAAQLERANLFFVDATVRFAAGMRRTPIPLEALTLETPIGKVAIGTRGNDRHAADAALIIDPGGDDVYERAPARSGAVSVIIDLAGNDEYRGSDLVIRGFSAIVDLSGDDRYAMEHGLGSAIAGASLLIEVAGNDSYTANSFGQGAAAFGFGALVDLAGDDRYDLAAWGQGLGIAGGVGLLWDRGGADVYAVAGVPDPFQRGAGLSGAQGAGFGVRGRIAGGIGILRDDGGDDTYEAQMFAQGSGYYYGLGLLWDHGGADRYDAFRYAQGNAAHQAVGVLRDEGGSDRYALADIYGQGMGLDVAIGILVDSGGSDRFAAHAVAQAAATANGFGLLDHRGEGRFELADDRHGWGRAEWLRGLPSIGVLLHAHGAQFSRNGKPAAPPSENPPVSVQPRSAESCPSDDPGEALVCRVRDSPDVEATWKELASLLRNEAQTPFAGWIAIALARRPPANGEEIARLLAQRESCNVRALALRAWPTLTEAKTFIHSGCFRLQAAARAALLRLGVPPPADARLPAFLRSIPPQEDTE